MWPNEKQTEKSSYQMWNICVHALAKRLNIIYFQPGSLGVYCSTAEGCKEVKQGHIATAAAVRSSGELDLFMNPKNWNKFIINTEHRIETTVMSLGAKI